MSLNMDFGGGTKARGGFEPLPEGTYNARIDEIDVKDTKEKEGVPQKTSDGNQAQYLNVKYKITDGDYEGRVVFGIQSIRFPDEALNDTDKERTTREMFLAWLNTVTGTDFAGTQQELDLKKLVGSPVRLVINHREYQGEIQDNIKKVLPHSDENEALESVRRSL